jgi:hypothetical protein
VVDGEVDRGEQVGLHSGGPTQAFFAAGAFEGAFFAAFLAGVFAAAFFAVFFAVDIS